MVRIIIIAVLVIMQAVFGAPSFLLGEGDYWVRALSYSFFHANWFHLAVNCIAVWGLFQPKYLCKPCRDLLLSFIIAVLVYPISFRPVIGFSNMLYAVIGMRTPPLRNPWWKQSTVIIFLVVTVSMVFIPRFSATTHIASFLLGMAVASGRRAYHKITKDARRYL